MGVFAWTPVVSNLKKMTKFTGNSYYLITKIFFSLFPFILFGILFYNLNAPIQIYYGGFIAFSFVMIYIIYLLSKLVYVEFNDENMIIKYLILRKTKSIPYKDLIKFTCIDGKRGHHLNMIEFKDRKLNKRKIKIDRIVDSDKFIDFTKWIKDKNSNMDFKIIPSDSILLTEYRKEFND